MTSSTSGSKVKLQVTDYGHTMTHIPSSAMDSRYEVTYVFLVVCRVVCTRVVGTISSEGLLVNPILFSSVQRYTQSI